MPAPDTGRRSEVPVPSNAQAALQELEKDLGWEDISLAPRNL